MQAEQTEKKSPRNTGLEIGCQQSRSASSQRSAASNCLMLITRSETPQPMHTHSQPWTFSAQVVTTSVSLRDIQRGGLVVHSSYVVNMAPQLQSDLRWQTDFYAVAALHSLGMVVVTYRHSKSDISFVITAYQQHLRQQSQQEPNKHRLVRRQYSAHFFSALFLSLVWKSDV